MRIDPVDFLCYTSTNNSNNPATRFSSFFSHFFALVLGAVLCIGVLYHIASKLDYESFSDDISLKSFEESLVTCRGEMQDLQKQIKRLRAQIENLHKWRQNVDHMITKSLLENQSIDERIAQAIDTYDSDKVGLFDFAAEYAGGSVDSTPDTCAYPSNKSIVILGMFNFRLTSNPQIVLQPSNLPGSCFAFHGTTGKIRIKLGKPIEVKAVTIEHSALALLEDPASALKDFEIYGLENPYDDIRVLLGKYTYLLQGRHYQIFPITLENNNKKFEYVELRILSNYGNEEFTCLYRVRVHSEQKRCPKKTKKT